MGRRPGDRVPRGTCRLCKRGPLAIYARGLCSRCYQRPELRAKVRPYQDQLPWLSLEVDRLARLRSWGLSYQEIAERLGRTKGQVCQAILRHLKGEKA